jgi:hypothetical protein
MRKTTCLSPTFKPFGHLKTFLSPASLELTEISEKGEHFLWLPLRRTAAINRFRPSAGKSFPRSGRPLFHCRPLTGNEKIVILWVLCALCERYVFVKLLSVSVCG